MIHIPHAPRRCRFGPSRSAILCAAALLAPSATAQITFSIDWKSQSVAQPASSAGTAPITEADLLVPPVGAPAFGPLQNPAQRLSGQFLGIQNYAACVGHPPGSPCEIELDAVSSGHDTYFLPGQTGLIGHGGSGGGGPEGSGGADRRRIWFSVDEYAAGNVSTPTTPLHASVFNQGNPLVPPGSPGVFEACADVFVDTDLPSGPIPPTFSPRNSAGSIDGNGLVSANGFRYLGLGLEEPRPTNTPFPHPGDNLDALEIGTDIAAQGFAFISLDSAFFDRLEGVFNTGSAANNGFRGGDVLRTSPGAPLTLYASAASLGLDLLTPDSDDLDALILRENGDGIFVPSLMPYDWLGGGTDMLIFSVRRGSAIINQPDSIFGAPIQPGDMLIPPVAGGNGRPGIFVAAEALGLRTFRGVAAAHGDDVDALEVTDKPCFDCNENGVEDAVDIANGSSLDANSNGIPDECEDGVLELCPCPNGSSGSCNNASSSGGCENSTNVGGLLLSNIASGGSVSVGNDDLVLTASQLPLGVSGLFFTGTTSKPPSTFYAGLRCIESPTLRYALQNSGAGGTMALGPGIVALALARFGPSGWIDPGESWYYQVWYRDNAGPCGQGSNTTNSIRVTYIP